MGFEVQSPPEAMDLWVQRGVGGGETLKDGSWACGDLRGPAGTCVDLCLSRSLSAVIKGLLPSDSQGSWSRVGWGEGPGPLLGTSVGPGSALPSLTRPRVCPTLPGPHLESRSPGTPWGRTAEAPVGGPGARSPGVLGAVISSRDRSVKLWSPWFNHTGTQVLLGRHLYAVPASKSADFSDPHTSGRPPETQSC